jgi:hypothetical protein
VWVWVRRSLAAGFNSLHLHFGASAIRHQHQAQDGPAPLVGKQSERAVLAGVGAEGPKSGPGAEIEPL